MQISYVKFAKVFYSLLICIVLVNRLELRILIIYVKIMEKEKMYAYESPLVELIEIEVEKGFYASTENLGDEEIL